MEEKEWINHIIRYVVNISVGPSTLRGQSAKGKNHIARKYLRKMSLSELSKIKSQKSFNELLTQHTESLSGKLPISKKNYSNWGAARKVINIYLIQCVLNRHLYEHYKLKSIEKFMEVPLDSHTFNHIKKKSKNLDASQSFRIINLTPELNKIIQLAARVIANDEYKCYRYKLDPIFWRKNSKKKKK